MLEEFTNKFTEQKLLHVEKIGRSYYQVMPDLKDTIDMIRPKLRRDPISAGLFLGEEKTKKFYPSLALLDIIGRATDRWVTVDEKAEWLFLCGRDLFASSIIKANVKQGMVLVANHSKEVLGYGKIVGDLTKKETVFVKNFLDKGDYLRREMH